ncbi:MAG TPA: metallophosphoesterase family protein [Candidatus Omnitrophota bacterium]|jgi:predicted phosphodiesterase|nr:MAG: phosphodiesterase [Candidatus Omnitrophica bacterium ADurb.Bin314]HOE68676.1 metallophosphoesterase family protein [Candidatus Omnitrophota bacterium]HPW65177.1 metallophosphoesterase family protein [Candidatus Omnitrophota bacterium]HQB94046.1 metallophosphoesterase family protein [Candidatus Omnitrophota bacterium]
MKYAVLADIHGNLEALEAIKAYLEARNLTTILCLGDSIGYGANPNECFEWVLAHASLHVLGNHEAAVFHEKTRWSFNDWSRVAIDWTAERLRPELVKKIESLPYLRVRGPLTVAHGTIHRPGDFEYLMDDVSADKSFRALGTDVGIVGHSHIPCWFSEAKPGAGGYFREGVLRLEKGDRYLLNPGSVGQPRDRDPRLSFGIFDPGELTFEIVRLPYDNKKAARKIRAEGLSRVFADRLL